MGNGGVTNARPLIGLRVGVSVGESDDLRQRGFTSAAMNRLTVRLTSALLARGAVLAFGHDWRQQGVMEAVCRAALDSFGYPGKDDPRPLIFNLIPWPDRTEVPEEILRRLPGVLAIEKAGLPSELRDRGAEPDRIDPEARRYLRARGLTCLRHGLTAVSGARICLGGRERSFQGRYPGILEEALFALEAGQPIYLVGLLGGAALTVGRTILDGEPWPEGFGEAAFAQPENGARPLADLYEEERSWQPFRGRPWPVSLDACEPDLQGIWRLARDLGADRLLQNGLSPEENHRLLETASEEEALHLVMTGLLRVFPR
ncbi:MAG TPA: hypothetical protein VKK31_22155 [Thermoanaerobaculia bacterium]|nr:hypothetical protein [Thermoanaerobaculia bacterium]